MNHNSTDNTKNTELNLPSNPILRWVLMGVGFLFVGIGIVGVFLPILPTTIFFLLAAWCFARSSERFYNWLHNNKLFGKYLRNYRNGNGMTLKAKVFSISFLWLGIIASMVWATTLLYVRILLFAIAVGVTWHLLAIKTSRE